MSKSLAGFDQLLNQFFVYTLSVHKMSTQAEVAPAPPQLSEPLLSKSSLQELEEMIANLEGRVRERSRTDKEAILTMRLQMKKLSKVGGFVLLGFHPA